MVEVVGFDAYVDYVAVFDASLDKFGAYDAWLAASVHHGVAHHTHIGAFALFDDCQGGQCLTGAVEGIVDCQQIA